MSSGCVYLCVLLSIVIATDFYGKQHIEYGKCLMLFWYKTDKILFVSCPLLTKVPSVTWMRIFVSLLLLSTIYHFMHVLLVAGAQTDAYTTPIFEETRKKEYITFYRIKEYIFQFQCRMYWNLTWQQSIRVKIFLWWKYLNVLTSI